MKNLVVLLFTLLSVCTQAQGKYFYVDSTYSPLIKLIPFELKDVPTPYRGGKVNSSIFISTSRQLPLLNWMASTLRTIFGPMDDEKLTLLKNVSFSTRMEDELKVAYYEYRFYIESFDKFMEHEESFYRFAEAFRSKDMRLYYKIEYPDMFVFCYYLYPLGVVYMRYQ